MAYRNDLSQLKNQATYNNDLMSLIFDNITDEELKEKYPPQPIHPNAIDITGQKFGKMVALWKVGNQRQGHSSRPIYAFRCDCGKVKFSTSHMARSGQITTCGCGLQERGKAKRLNLLGKKFGRLTVVQELAPERYEMHWLCQCECGNTCKRSSNELNGLHPSTSCGICIQYDSIRNKLIEQNDSRNIEILSKPINTLVGLYYGKLYIYEETNQIKSTNKIFKAKCECGRIIDYTIAQMRNNVDSCGCYTAEKFFQTSTKIHPGDKFGKLTVIEPTRKENETHVFWKCQCECGSITFVRSTSLLDPHGTRSCGCIHSKGEEKIAQILSENSIIFEKEKIYNDLKSPLGWSLRYDFLINNQFLLEFDGAQHFEETNRGDTLEKRQTYDKIKDEYAKSHNIPLKRIPYWDYDRITIENIMDDTYLIN